MGSGDRQRRTDPGRQPRPVYHRVGVRGGAGTHRRLVRNRSGGRENRRWCIPVFAAGLVPLVVGCAVNYSKFGVLFGVSNFEQVWTHVNAYRRKFLAANHDAEEGTIFVPTNIVAYLRPNGLRLTSVFPFVTLPASPPPALSGVLFDRQYRTASLPASTPLLFLLELLGTGDCLSSQADRQGGADSHAAAGRRRRGRRPAVVGLHRSEVPGGLRPLSGVGQRGGHGRHLASAGGSEAVGTDRGTAAITVVALFSHRRQYRHRHHAQRVVEHDAGPRLCQGPKDRQRFHRHPSGGAGASEGARCPPWAPADQLYVIGDCDGLYISNGEDYSTVPSEQFVRTTWMTVELGHDFQRTFRSPSTPPKSGGTEHRFHWSAAGKYTVAVNVARTANPKRGYRAFGCTGPGKPSNGARGSVSLGFDPHRWS